MTVTSPTQTRRLNPFAFPANTDTLFMLLILAILCASFIIYDFFYIAFNQDIEKTMITCLTLTPNSVCILLERNEAAWNILGVVLLLGVAGIIYWIWPIARIWRRNLKPFQADNEIKGKMLAFLSSLCQEAGISRVPTFLTDSFTSLPVTFGRLGRYYITVPGTMVVQFQRDLPTFRAIMFHELGHIRNADIDKTYFALAVVQAFTVFALLPWVYTQIYYFSGSLSLIEIGIVLCLSVIIYLMLNALLRTREVYADVRASAWEGQSGALARNLASLRSSRKNPLRRLLETHPDRQVRMRMLENTSGLFLLQPWQAFITGLIVSSTLSNIVWLIKQLNIGQGFWLDQLAPMSAGLLFALIIGGTVGIDIWRATFAKKAQGKVLPNMALAALGLTLGLLLGQLLSLFSDLSGGGYFSDVRMTFFVSWWSWGIMLFASSAILYLLLLLLFRWMRTAVASWLEIAAAASTPRYVYVPVICIFCVVLSIWSGEFNMIRTTIEPILALRDIQAGQELLKGPLYYWYRHLQALNDSSGFLSLLILIVFDAISLLLINPLILALFIIAWGLPLAVWCWQKQGVPLTRSTWAYLENLSQPSSSLSALKPSFRLHLAIIIGLGGGLVFCALLPFFFRGFFYDDQIALAVMVQAAIAIIVANIVTHMRVAHGLFAAFIAGCIMALGIIGFNQLRHNIDLTNQETFLWIMNGGAFVTLLLAAPVAAISGWLRSNRRYIQPQTSMPGTP